MAAGAPLTPRRRAGEPATIRRIAAVVVVALSVVAGLLVPGQLPGAAGDITGDALYAVAVYAGLVALAPRASSLLVAGIAAAWCVAVELFQLTGLPEQWGAAFRPIMLVFGTVFDPRDLVVYVLSVAAAAAIDVVARRRATRTARS